MRALLRFRVWIAAALVVMVLAGGLGLWLLPRLVRSMAVTRIAEITGRPVALEKVELNLFTGRVALQGFRLGQRESAEPALTFDRLELRVALAALVLKHARITELTLQSPAIYVTRTGPDTFDFADLLALIPPSDPAKPPSKVVMTVDRVSVHDLRVVARDAVPSPPTEWKIADFSLEGSGLTTKPEAAPGRLAIKGRLNDTPFAVDATEVKLAGGAVTTKLSIDGFPLAAVSPYVPATIAVLPKAGTLKVALAAALPGGGLGGQISGTIQVEGLEVARRDDGRRLLALPRLALAIENADLAKRAVTLSSLEIERLALGVTRAANGEIDVLRLVAPREDAAAPAPAAVSTPASDATAAAAPPFSVTLKRLALTDADLQFTDEAVTPKTTLKLSKFTATLRDVTWPIAGPAAVELATNLPDKGRVTVKGAVVAQPLDADLTVSLRDGSIAPYGAYMPFKARFGGSFNGDNRWRLRIVDGAIKAESNGGESWIDNIVVAAADAEPGAAPLGRTQRLRFSGIDFAWPGHARVKKITMTRPDIRVEREKDGTLTLRKIFEVDGDRPGQPSAAPTPTAKKEPAAKKEDAEPAAQPKPLPIALEFGEIVIEEGFARFVDRSVEPAFSESLSRLAVSVKGLSSKPGQRADLTAQAIVGGNAALDVKGQLAPLGRLYADLDVELRNFALPAVTPYVDQMLAWKIERGKLVAHLHYTVDGDQLTARNEVTLGNLEVAKAADDDRAKKRLGLPLGMIVSLIKDGNGDIKVNVPVSGSLSDPKFELGEAIWTAIRNVLVNVVAAPFRAIGRLFTSGDNKIEQLAVEPVIFEPGSAVITPSMEQHVLRVAQFLKGAPAVTLALAPVTSARDTASLRAQELTARLQAVQRDQKLPSYAQAVAAEFLARYPGTKPPLPPTDDQIAKLLELEPLPADRPSELATRRLQAVQQALETAGGIPATRLTAAAPVAPGDDTGDGRVDFRVGP